MRRSSSSRPSALVALILLLSGLGHVHPRSDAPGDPSLFGPAVGSESAAAASRPTAGRNAPPTASHDDAHHEHSSRIDHEPLICPVCRSQREGGVAQTRAALPAFATAARPHAPVAGRRRADSSRTRTDGPRAPPVEVI